MMNWKELFDEDRLLRGYNYFLEDRVYDVVLTENSITSKVEGSRSHIYEVKITFNENKIESLYCTCPYCYADFNCKHMVATLHKMEEINSNTKNNILDSNYDELSLFSELIKTADEKQLRSYIFDKFKEDNDFIEDFINNFQKEFTPEDFDNYENMLDNIFNIDIVELYNENGFYQETPFHKYLENFINEKISLLYKNKEYPYVLQLLYITYENISEKIDVTQYIEINNILDSCNYYLEKIIEVQNTIENEEIFSYLINKIRYDYNQDITKCFIDICIKKFNSTTYIQQLDESIDYLIENNEVSDEILLSKYEIMKIRDYPDKKQCEFLKTYKDHVQVMQILVNNEIEKNNIEGAIDLLNENKEIHGETYSLENNVLLLELYKIKQDKERAVDEIKNILYEYNIKDMTFVNDLKELSDEKEWKEEKSNLINFYQETFSYDFLNRIFVEEEDYEDLFKNVTKNCNIQTIEKYRKYYEKEHSRDILKIYKQYILEQAKTAKNISAYTLILTYIDYMLSYRDSTEIVRDLISVLKNKYNQRKLFMEKIEELEIINSLQ